MGSYCYQELKETLASLTEDTSVKNSLTGSSLLLITLTGMIADNHIVISYNC
jgi:hypothetical protein